MTYYTSSKYYGRTRMHDNIVPWALRELGTKIYRPWHRVNVLALEYNHLVFNLFLSSGEFRRKRNKGILRISINVNVNQN